VDLSAKSGKLAGKKPNKSSRKASSERHTRAIQRDHTKHAVSAPPAAQIQERLTKLVYPAALAQLDYFHRLGLRERTLGLVVMVAYVLDLIWRQLGGVSELVRIIQTEGVLWAAPAKSASRRYRSAWGRCRPSCF